MLGKQSRRFAPLAGVAALLLAASAASPAVAQTEPDVVIPASESCKTFDLGLTATGGGIKVREFSNGNVYKVGTGVVLTWSNQSNGKTYTVKTSGSVSRYVKNPDGTYTLTLTGHNGFVYFSTDKTGPGAFQYTGRVVLQVDNPDDNNVSRVDAKAGKAVDICARLK